MPTVSQRWLAVVFLRICALRNYALPEKPGSALYFANGSVFTQGHETQWQVALL